MEICWDRYRLGTEVKVKKLKCPKTFGTFRPMVLVVGKGRSPKMREWGGDPVLRNRRWGDRVLIDRSTCLEFT